MSNYIKRSTLEYPVHEGDIRLEYPDIAEHLTGAEFPCPDTFSKVVEVEPPEVNPAVEVFYELTPVLQADGKYYKSWAIRELTEEEKDTVAFFANSRRKIGVERV
jgi:hypothetical protein